VTEPDPPNNSTMKFKVSCLLEYNLNSPATFLFALKCLQTGGQDILSELLTTTPAVDIEDFHILSGMNRFSRIRTVNPGTLSIHYEAEVDVFTKTVQLGSLRADPTAELNPEGIPFLFPSRYCQSDQLGDLATQVTDGTEPGYDQAEAIRKWIHENIRYEYGTSNASTSAIETAEKRVGVCRDYTHLGISLCRALNIPARMVVGYLYQLDPMDMHAWFEAYVDGRWFTFDATQKAPRGNRITVAYGRDAADVAFTTQFGPMILNGMRVWADASADAEEEDKEN